MLGFLHAPDYDPTRDGYDDGEDVPEWIAALIEAGLLAACCLVLGGALGALYYLARLA